MMFSYLENSESLKVSTKELKDQILSPNESSVMRQARSEKHKKFFQIFSRQVASEIRVASMARCEVHLECLHFCNGNAWTSGKQSSV